MIEQIRLTLKRTLYLIRQDFLTLNNVVLVAALLIALNWTWSSIETMQQNHELQQAVDRKRQQLTLEQLRVDTLELEGKYFKTLEFQELAVRERLGKGLPGERVVIVPPTTDATTQQAPAHTPVKDSNFQEWMNFLSARNRQDL